MAALVTQDQALRQLRLVEAALTADQLADVNDKADQASAIVMDYLKRQFIEGPLAPQQQRRARPSPGQQDWTTGGPPDGWWDTTPPPPPALPGPPDPWTVANAPTLVKAAILIVLTSLYDGRTPLDDLLSPAVTAILWRYRDPAMA